jgi:hypothetical protein
LIECKSSKQKLGLIGLQFRSSLNQALVFSLIVDKSADSKHISTSVFFIRVSGNSLHLLTEAMASMYDFAPSHRSEPVFAKALQRFLEQDQNRDKVLFQPIAWYDGSIMDRSDAVVRQPFSHATSTRYHGDIESVYLQALDMKKAYNDPKELPPYPSLKSTHLFWHSVAEARRVLDEAKERGHTAEHGEWREMVKEVRDWVELRAYDTVEVNRRVEALREGSDIARDR